MSEEIRIRLKSTRYEVEESLFTAAAEQGEMGVLSEMGEPEPQVIEICSLGKMTRGEGRIEISYEETEATGMAGSSTALTFLEQESGVVSMIREGAVSTVLVFEAGKRHHCVYNTPFMPFEVCVHTLKVDNRLMTEGYLDLDYVIEIRGAQAERTKFRMEIR